MTADLRSPGGRLTTAKMFAGSVHPRRIVMRTFCPGQGRALYEEERARHPARSGGVWVASASASTHSGRPGRQGPAREGRQHVACTAERHRACPRLGREVGAPVGLDRSC